MIIKRNFYNQDTIKVARGLLGCYLIRKHKGKTIHARITETEAYRGEHDLASHASKGRTDRTKIMFGLPGYAYVYMIYGMYFMLNVVTEKKDFPAAVLIRGISVGGSHMRPENRKAHARSLHNMVVRLDGPGKLAKFLHIDRSLNGHDLTVGNKLWLEYPKTKRRLKITRSPRVGIDYARHCKEWKWNFKLEN